MVLLWFFEIKFTFQMSANSLVDLSHLSGQLLGHLPFSWCYLYHQSSWLNRPWKGVIKGKILCYCLLLFQKGQSEKLQLEKLMIYLWFKIQVNHEHLSLKLLTSTFTQFSLLLPLTNYSVSGGIETRKSLNQAICLFGIMALG